MSSDTNADLTSQAEPAAVETGNGSSKYFNSKKNAVYRALVANLGIAGIKFVCFAFSKSSAMLSESIHSLVDSFNSLCLLVGIKRGSRPADEMHPFGYGLEANIWALFACVLMLLGTAIAFFSGVTKIVRHSAEESAILLDNYYMIVVVLLLSILFELWAVASASRAVLTEAQVQTDSNIKNFLKSVKYIKKIKSPTTKFVWYEDTAALCGVIIALIALTISRYALPVELAYLPDGIASLIIGTILFVLAIYLLKNNVNFLTGHAATPQVEKIIKEVANDMHGVDCVHELKTMDMGSSGLIVNMNIEVAPNTPVKDADNIADLLERNIRKKIDNISHVNIEIQADDAEEEWGERFEKLIEEGKEIEAIDTHEGNILANFSSFANTVAKEVMVPRTKVCFVNVENTLDELADLIIETGHTRIPVFRDTMDNIIGVVNSKDVLKALKNTSNPPATVEELAREIMIIPENKFISDLLKDFTSTKNQMAAIIDEHGGIAGIVTLEDILEELVGEIYDEYDKVETPLCVKIDDNSLHVSSKMQIDDINERFDLDIPQEDFNTIGGYVFGLLGREPTLNDTFEDKDITYTIIEMEGRTISKVRMKKQTPFTDKESQNAGNETEVTNEKI